MDETWRIFIDLRQAGAAIGIILVALYGWLVFDTLTVLRDPNFANRRGYRRRLQFAFGIALTWLSMLGTNLWFSAYHMLGEPLWMRGSPFVAAMIVIGMVAALVHVRVATQERWGEGPWILTAAFVSVVALVV